MCSTFDLETPVAACCCVCYSVRQQRRHCAISILSRPHAIIMKRKADGRDSETLHKRARCEQPPTTPASQLRDAIEGGQWERAAQLMDAGATLDMETIRRDIWAWRANSMSVIHRLAHHFPPVAAGADAWTPATVRARNALRPLVTSGRLAYGEHRCPCQMSEATLSAMRIVSPEDVFCVLYEIGTGYGHGHSLGCGLPVILDRLPPPEIPSTEDGRKVMVAVVRDVCSEGLADFLPRLLGGLPRSSMPVLGVAVECALDAGRVDLLPFLLEKLNEGCDYYYLKPHIKAGLEQALAKRRWDLVSWLAQRLTTPTPSPLEEGGVGLEEALGRVTDPYAQSFLFREACGVGALSVVDTLLRMRSPRAFQRHHLESATIRAAGNGHLDVLERLFEHDLAGATEFGVIEAARSGHLDVLRFLFDRNVACTVDHLIHTVAASRNPEVIRLVRERRAPVESHLIGWLSAVAHLNNSLADVKAILATVTEQERKRQVVAESHALRRAAWAGCTETAHFLLSEGLVADVNALPSHLVSKTALTCAVERGFPDIVTLLLEYGATVDSTTFAELCAADVLGVLLRHYLPRLPDATDRGAFLAQLYCRALSSRGHLSGDRYRYEVAYLLETRWPNYCRTNTDGIYRKHTWLYSRWKEERLAQEAALREVLPCQGVINIILSYRPASE